MGLHLDLHAGREGEHLPGGNHQPALPLAQDRPGDVPADHPRRHEPVRQARGTTVARHLDHARACPGQRASGGCRAPARSPRISRARRPCAIALRCSTSQGPC